MHSVAEALDIVLAQTKPLPPVAMALTPETLGLILAEDVVSDLDMPPFDKAMMDGFALRSADLSDGQAELAIIEEITAGTTPKLPIAAGQASRIMTGAPVPVGADAVVMIERCTLAGDTVRVNDSRLSMGQNVLPRGREMRTGETVLRAGDRLRRKSLGCWRRLAAPARRCSRHRVWRFCPRAMRSLSRRSCLDRGRYATAMVRCCWRRFAEREACRGFSASHPMNRASLRAMIAEGLESDVLLLSGGVSAGKLDLVPGVLAELGVQPLFHKIAMKPGKPVLFGVKESKPPHPQPLSPVGARGKLVFGLPGNPVGAMVAFELFVRPAHFAG